MSEDTINKNVEEVAENAAEKQVVIPEFYRDLNADAEQKGLWHYVFRTNGDRKIVRLMWIYDINYSWTMRKIVERGYIDKIVDNLPMDERIAEGVRRLKAHVENKLKEF